MAQHVTTIEALGRLVDHQMIYFLRPIIALVEFSDIKKHEFQLTQQSVNTSCIGILAVIKEPCGHLPVLEYIARIEQTFS